MNASNQQELSKSRTHLISRLRKAMDDGDGMVTGSNTATCADALIHDALECEASDIHFVPGVNTVQLRLRIDGALLDVLRIPSGQANRLVRHFKSLSDLDPTPASMPLVARRSIKVNDLSIDIRLATAPTVFGEKLVLRILDPSNLDKKIHALGLSDHEFEVITDWLRVTSGMFLVTGPTGSGKTTTLYALLHEMRRLERSIVTIEDPVEYRIEGVSQMQVNLRHGLTFAEGVRAMLRLDVDYMLLGEIRDEATAQAALDASGTGRTLMSTLHARDAVGAVTALRNWDLSDHEIATSLQVVVAQRLVRKLCKACRRLESLKTEEQQWLNSLGLPVPSETWHAVGCDECRQIGYSGRTGVFEVWQLQEHDYDMILNHADERSIREQLCKRDHRPLLVDGLSMVEDGTTALDELRLLGSFYVPPDGSKTAKLLQIGDQS